MIKKIISIIGLCLLMTGCKCDHYNHNADTEGKRQESKWIVIGKMHVTNKITRYEIRETENYSGDNYRDFYLDTNKIFQLGDNLIVEREPNDSNRY